MYHKAHTIAYGLAIFVLMNGLFVLHNANDAKSYANVANFKQEVRMEFAGAWVQTVGDQPWFAEVALIFDSVDNFYNQAAQQTIALLDPNGADEDIARVGREMAWAFAKVGSNTKYTNSHTNATNDTNGRVAGESIINWDYNPSQPPLILRGGATAEEPPLRIRDAHSLTGRRGLGEGELRSEFMTEEPIYNIIPEENLGSVKGIYYLPYENLPAENSSGNPWVTIKDAVSGQSFCVAIFNNEINKYEGECKQDRYQ